jgi:hypothetical protein
MATNSVQETLDRLLEELKSNDSVRTLNAIQELNQLNFSSRAIVLQLERLALKEADEIQKAALLALSSKTSQYIASQRSLPTKFYRSLILKEIDGWQKDELIEPHQAEVLRRHYDFDIQRAAVVRPASVQVVKDAQSSTAEGNIEQVEKKQGAPGQSTAARPSLMETLLSEASIKIYLYLGAFFVIASALILAAVVEAARLPILAAATLAFGGGALILHKRLPQPSFALFIVFSFLLPIDANVLEETIGFTEPSLSIYWTIVFLTMAIIWGVSVWLYESRFFSAVAFVSLSLAIYRAGEIFNTETELQIFLGMLASLAGLAGTSLLRKWKDHRFSRPVFLLAQLQVLGLLLISLILVVTHTLDSDISNGWWILVALTWLTASSFYVLSDILIPTFFFPWMAVAALLPLPWFFLRTFNPTQPVYAVGFWVWGAVFALASEAVIRLKFEKAGKYHPALLAGSALLFLTSFYLAFVWDKPVLTFAIFGLTALVYTATHLLRPRWYIWSAALCSALFAYFTFFSLPTLENLEVPYVYQLLIASTLLVVPELFAKTALSLESESRWPTIGFGIFISLAAISLALTDFDHTGRSALVLIIYAIFFTLHALHGKREWLGYFAAAAESLAVVYALDHFNLDLWLPALTILAILYYASGFFFRRRVDEIKAWGSVLINSGLTLGVLLSLTSLVLFKETSGWYILVIALLFVVEIFARPLVWLELVVESLLSLALYLILDEFNVAQHFGHFLFGASLIWLVGDLIFGRLIQEKRAYRPIVLFVGYVLVFMATVILWVELNPALSTIYFFLFALFFASYARLQGEPRLGYLAAAFLPLAVIKFCDILHIEKWIFPVIGLAVLYYLSGYWLRRNQKAIGWDQMLLHSGLGLGVITSFSAPFQGGLDSSIPVAIAATLFAAEAFALGNVWWALPADAFYLISYFMILAELDVDEPQYYSIGAALLGMLMHYLLTRAGSKTGAFIAGMLSQLVLLGTTYIQMLSTEKLSFFFVLFIQSMIVLIYGLIQRSRSLVITPIAFAVIGVVTVVYSALKGLGTVILIGSTGVVLLMAGIVAVLMRERITRLGEQLSDWKP